MESYSIADAKARLSEIIEQVETGATVDITKRGKLVARIAPPQKPLKPVDVDALRRLTANHSYQHESAGDFMRRVRDEARY